MTVGAYLPANSFTAAIATTTAANGTYVLHAVPAGNVNVLFTPPVSAGLVGQWYNAAANRAAATAIVLNSGAFRHRQSTPVSLRPVRSPVW